MQILRLLAARRAASTIIASPVSERRDDEGDFFDLDFSSCSVRASSSSSDSLSFSDSDDECTVLDFITSLERSSFASPLFRGGAAAPLNFCVSDPPTSKAKAGRRRGISALRTPSFRARKAAPLYDGGRHSFGRTSSGRRSYARRARSLPLFMDSPRHAEEDDEHHASEQTCRRAPSRDVIRRCLAKISRRLRTAASPRAIEARGLRRLRKCRSASSAAPRPSSVERRDDSVLEKQDGIAGAIAHCKESLHRASTSECDSPLLRSRSDPGKREAGKLRRLVQADG